MSCQSTNVAHAVSSLLLAILHSIYNFKNKFYITIFQNIFFSNKSVLSINCLLPISYVSLGSM